MFGRDELLRFHSIQHGNTEITEEKDPQISVRDLQLNDAVTKKRVPNDDVLRSRG